MFWLVRNGLPGGSDATTTAAIRIIIMSTSQYPQLDTMESVQSLQNILYFLQTVRKNF